MTGEGGPPAMLERLWAVQQADARILEVRARREALDDGASLRAEAASAQAAAADAAARLHRAQAALRDHELQLQTAEAKQKKAHADLYGGRVSNPKELAGLEEELGALARSRDHLEDRILALMDEVEALRGEDASARAALAGIEQRLAARTAEFETARGGLEADLTVLQAQRAERAAAVDAALLKKYQGIAAQEAGVGMVRILGDFCGGCRNTVPAQFVSRVREGRVVTCERCHRILYLDGGA